MQELSMLKAADEGDKAKDDSIEVRGSDSYQMFVDVTVRYFIESPSAPSLFRLVGTEDGVKQRLVRPDVRELVRIEFTKYTAEEAYTAKRQAILDNLTASVKTDLQKYGLRLDSIAIRNVALESTLAKAIADRAAAREQALQATIEQGKQVTEAETRRKVAETDAQAKVIAAKGEADSNNILNASLTPELLQLRRIEALEKANTIYVPDNSNILVGAGAPIK
jgi:regulator of protease activity HflC (stomatin/prohibitin superfamily)